MKQAAVIKEDEMTVDETSDDMLSSFIAGCVGNITIKTPFGERRISSVKTGKKTALTPRGKIARQELLEKERKEKEKAIMAKKAVKPKKVSAKKPVAKKPKKSK